MKNFFNLFYFMFIFIVSIVNAQWSTTIETDGDYTNQGNMVDALEDRNGGVYLVYTIHEWQSDNTQTEIPYFFHIDKYGYKITPVIELPIINDYQSNHQLFWSSDNNIFVVSMDYVFTEFVNGLAQYRRRSMLSKIDTNGTPLWAAPVLITIDSVDHNVFQLEPDRDGGCYLSVSKGKRKIVQKISPDGERLWGDQGVILYEGRQANGFQNVPPNIHLRSDDKLFVHTITNIYSPSKVNLISDMGEILAETELDSRITTFNSYLNSEDELLHLGFHGGYSDHAEDLILDKFISSGNNTIESEEITIMDQTDYGMDHRKSNLLDNNIHLLWSHHEGSTNKFYYQIITPNNITVLDSIGFYTNSAFLIIQDSTTTLLQNLDTLNTLFRMDHDGNILWGKSGIKFTLDDCLSSDNKLVSDGSEGVIVLWNSCVSGVRAKQINKNGELGIVTEVRGTDDQVPNNFFVSNNYPNPFNPSTTIDYYLPITSDIDINVTNVLGEIVYTTKESNKLPGNYSFQFNADKLASGIYFAVFSFNSLSNYGNTNIFTRKILLVK